MTDLSEYVLELRREGPDFTFCRGRQHGNPSPVLALALAAEQPPPQLRRLEHEYSQVTKRDIASVVNLWIRFLNVTSVKTELFGRLR